MSGPLAIAGVTATLRDLLNNGLIDHNIAGALGTNVTVTASPPDTIAIGNDNATTQLNLFMHQVTPNQGWRNVGLPSRDSAGTRLSNPPLALDLHYVLTAYGAEDLHSEILLGYAMHLLHETPVLGRQAIRTALAAGTVNPGVLPPAFQSADAADLADQIEQIKITPASLGTEEMSKLWSALQAHYRPTAAYLVSVVLIEAARSMRSALPVLTRRIRVEPNLLPPFPTLNVASPPDGQVAACLGDVVTLEGHHLSGNNLKVRFEHRQLAAPLERDALSGATDQRCRVRIPDATTQWPAGMWSVSVSVEPPGETTPRSSNAVPLALAPTLDIAASSAARDAATSAVTVSLAFKPRARPGQKISLHCGGREVPPQTFSAATGTLSFVYPALDAGNQWVRLRIDGADSRLVDRSSEPPGYDASQNLAIPA